VSLPRRLTSADASERLRAIDAVVADGRAAADVLSALAECLASRNKLIQRRAAQAFAALSAGGVAVQDILVATLLSPAQHQRWGAVYALSLLGPPPRDTLPVLLECLAVDDGDVRWAAADILVHMPVAGEVLDALRVLLRTGTAAQRKMAAYCLRDLDVRLPLVEQTMLAALDDADAGVRMAGMSALVRLSSDRAVLAQRLVRLIQDRDPGVRRAAAAALGAAGYRSDGVLTALRAAAADADPSLRRAAERSLRQLTDDARLSRDR
jgi:HEAT repeat protein